MAQSPAVLTGVVDGEFKAALTLESFGVVLPGQLRRLPYQPDQSAIDSRAAKDLPHPDMHRRGHPAIVEVRLAVRALFPLAVPARSRSAQAPQPR